MQFHKENFSTSSNILNIFAYRITRKDQITTHFYSRVIAYAKWRAPFLGYSKEKNLKVVCNCSTAAAMGVLHVLCDFFVQLRHTSNIQGQYKDIQNRESKS